MGVAAATAERLAFWLQPSSYIAPARLVALEPGLPPALAERLLGAPRLAARLSLRILDRAGLARGPLPDETPAFALARLPAAELARVARACGALLHHASIRAVVLREDRQRLRAFLGADAHELALRRAAFLRLPARLAPGRDGLEAAIERDGLACLRARYPEGEGAAPGLAGRLALKFASGSGFDAPDPELAGDAGRRVLARVLLEGDGAWRAYSS
jgi:hypothetical protein